MKEEETNTDPIPNLAKEPYAEYLPTEQAGLPTGQAGGTYSYADYLTWEMDHMVELIKGKVFRQAAVAPRRIHQKVSGHIFSNLHFFLRGKACQVYEAPFDVRLPVKSNRNDKIHTVVQPDICVVCDKNKLDDLGCMGAPDLIIEILSPGNNRKELKAKYEVYEESGVKEYWVVHPDEHTLLIYSLEEGKYIPSRLFTHGDVVQSKCIPGFKLDLEEVFGNLD